MLFSSHLALHAFVHYYNNFLSIFEQQLIILYLHHALNKVTQLANLHMHTFNFLFIKTYLKFLKTLF